MPWARASSLARHLECPAASHLPRFANGKWVPGYLHVGDFTTPSIVPEARDETAARWGTEMHLAKANSPEAFDPFLTWMDSKREEFWPERLGEHEVGVAYDCDTGKSYVAEGSPAFIDKWKSEHGPSYVVGTCDWWGELPSGEPWVDDLKTGWKTPEFPSPQLMFYLMCRMKEPNAQKFDSGRISFTHWPRKKGGSEPTRDNLWRQVSRAEIDAFELEIKAAWARVRTPHPYPKPGGHCLYCPSIDVCEAANR